VTGLLRTLLRRELGASWWMTLGIAAGSAVFGAWIAWHIAGAGYFDGVPADAFASTPLLARLVALPSLAGAIALVASGSLAIVRVAEDRQLGWLIPLTTRPGVRAAYPIALVCAAVAPVGLVYAATVGGFAGVRFALTGTAPSVEVELTRLCVVLAGCCGAAAYGIFVGTLLRQPVLAMSAAAALYAFPLVPALLAVGAGGEPGMLARALTLPVPSLDLTPAPGTLLRHAAYVGITLAVIMSISDRLFGRVP
jgi:hypothetical protein